MRKKRILLLLFLLIIFTNTIVSAQRRRGRGGVISGHVIDKALNSPVEYANIVLYNQKDSVQVTGTITNPDGDFQLTGLRRGAYFLSIGFIGYHRKIIGNLEINRGSRKINLGDISLVQTAIDLEAVEVVGEQAPVEYRIDKKVINVSRQYTTVSGTAVEVLENVPSVTVDVEGNVSLRGSTNFTVLIDGRLSVLEPNDALQQIPASTIEHIEIITNPSAKYDPDGNSGIINIILKKGKLHGRSGILNANAGLEDKWGGDFLLHYRQTKFNFNFGADYNKRFHPGTSEQEKQRFADTTTSFVLSNGDYRRGRSMYGLRGGVEFILSSNDNLGVGFRFGNRAMSRDADLDYDEWTEPGPPHQFYISQSKIDRSGKFYTANLNYQHRFSGKGHALTGEASYSYRQSDENSLNELFDTGQNITSGRRTTENGPAERFRLKFDYTLPLRQKDKFETGYQSRLSYSKDETGLFDFDTTQTSYVFKPEGSNITDYKRNIHSLYIMYAGEVGNLGYQAGFRGEVTDRKIALVDTNINFTIDRWDYFPTGHLSYKFSGGKQLLASYTRRIQRPRSWYLEPFKTWFDAFNVRSGNPALKPEYIDSYELGTQTYFGNNLISVEGYYRKTHNKIERHRTVDSMNVTLHSIQNVGTDYAFGAELMLNLDLLKWWNINCMGNLYNYRIDGQFDSTRTGFSRESFNWNTRINNSLKLGNSTRLQINVIYNSPTVSSQGNRKGFFRMNLALKQQFLHRRMTATLQINDVFSTARYEFSSAGNNFITRSRFDRKSPTVLLNLSYNINNYKSERRRGRNQENTGDEGEFEGG